MQRAVSSVPSAVTLAEGVTSPATTSTTVLNARRDREEEKETGSDGSNGSTGYTEAEVQEKETLQHVERVERAEGGDHTLPRRPWRRSVTPWAAIVGAEYKGSGTEDDPYIVVWLPHDVENPHTWKSSYKWLMTMISAVGMLAVTMSSSVISATITGVKAEFPGHHEMLYIMVTGIYILGFVCGPFIWAPFSEVFGRRPTVIVSFIPFVAFNSAVCGANSMNALLVLRFFAGTFGCSSMTNSGATISDMFEAHERGLAMGVFACMPFLGPVVGPIIGGWLGPASNWRWVAAVAAFFALFITIVKFMLLAETFAPVLLRKRAAALTKATGHLYRSADDVSKPLDTKALMKRQFRVPFKLLFTEPIVFFCSLYQATVFAILYLQFTSYPIVFQRYRHWSPGIGALAFVPIAIGTNLGLLYLAMVVTPSYAKRHKAEGYLPPEARLPPAMIGSVLLPVGLMWFAWTCVPVSIHWVVPLLATIPYGAGIVLTFIATQTYLVDAYLPMAASVIAGGTVVRSVLGVLLPLFTVDMYNALGVNWASALVAFFALIFTPVPFLLAAYGRRIRRWTKPGRDADDLGRRIAAMAAKKRAAAAEAVSAEAAAAGSPGAAAAEAEEQQLELEDAAEEERESKYATPAGTLSGLELGDVEKAIEGRGVRAAGIEEMK